MQQQQPVQALPSEPSRRAAAEALGERLREIADRRVWIPRLCYEILPVFYIFMGGAALLSTIFNRHWSWLVPHALLLGCFLIHLGLMVRRRRRRARQYRRS